MNTPQEAVSGTLSYFRICSGGIIFIVAYNVLGSIFRGIGDSKTPPVTVAIACVFNIAGDLFLVAVLDLKAAGAVIATIMAQAICSGQTGFFVEGLLCPCECGLYCQDIRQPYFQYRKIWGQEGSGET